MDCHFCILFIDFFVLSYGYRFILINKKPLKIKHVRSIGGSEDHIIISQFGIFHMRLLLSQFPTRILRE